MVCDGVLNSQRILKTVKRAVINNKLAVLSNKFSKQKFTCFIFIVKNSSVNNFYAVLIFYGYVGYHHIVVTTSLQPNCYI